MTSLFGWSFTDRKAANNAAGDRLVRWRPTLLWAVTVAVIVGVLSLNAIPQDSSYHLFADKRAFAGVPNFLDVTSNFPFLVIAILGWRAVFREPGSIATAARPAWVVFFFGIALTAFGSAYYHWQPNNASLVWDRLPMTISFMSLVSIIFGEYFSRDLGRKLLIPLLIVGIGSVAYWAFTEAQLRGDLRPYAIVQFLPMLIIPLIIALYRKRSDFGYYVGWMIGFYVLAKIAEHYDYEVYGAGHIVSGHTIKHLVAALAPATLVVALTRQQERA